MGGRPSEKETLDSCRIVLLCHCLEKGKYFKTHTPEKKIAKAKRRSRLDEGKDAAEWLVLKKGARGKTYFIQRT